jgi:two-component system chemotaxis response regulator CheB
MGNSTVMAAMRAQTRPVIRPGQRIRVLVVDDSVVIRRLVTQILGEDPVLEVVGSAANGLIALQKIPQVNPDVITLDVEMPEMNGLEALREIRRQYTQVRVIMFSTLTERGASTTLDALLLGADDYVTKASNVGSLDRSLLKLREELVPKIKQFFSLEQTPALPQLALGQTAPAQRLVSRTPTFAPPKQRKVVAIGISTGGPNALAEIIPMFPADFSVPIVMVQHMPPMFTQLLAQRLNAKSKIGVEEASEGSLLEAGKVLIAPGNYHMRLKRDGEQVRVTLDQESPENSCRPAVDVLFRSVNDVFGGATVAAVLTGMGQDGLRGVEQLKAEGAYIIAQDEASSVVWGMPGAIVDSGLADSVLDLKAVVPDILRQIG